MNLCFSQRQPASKIVNKQPVLIKQTSQAEKPQENIQRNSIQNFLRVYNYYKLLQNVKKQQSKLSKYLISIDEKKTQSPGCHSLYVKTSSIALTIQHTHSPSDMSAVPKFDKMYSLCENDPVLTLKQQPKNKALYKLQRNIIKKIFPQ